MNSLKVTICTPMYGVEKYIERCARSLFEQTYDNIEYVFVDDCARDRSVEVLQRVLHDYPQRQPAVRIVRHEHNRGLAAARRTGVENATGDYFTHVDGDDYLELDAIRKYVERAIETNADIVVSDHYNVMANGRTVYVDAVPVDKVEYVRRLLLRKASIKVWGQLVRRSFVMEHQLFPPEGLDLSEDYVLSPVMAYYANRVAKVDEPLLNYVKYNAESASTIVRRKGLETTVKAMELLEDFFAGVPDAADYMNVFPLAKLYNKVTLFSFASKADFDYIRPLYSEISVWRSSIELKHKLMLTLASMGFDSLVFRCIHLFVK